MGSACARHKQGAHPLNCSNLACTPCLLAQLHTQARSLTPQHPNLSTRTGTRARASACCFPSSTHLHDVLIQDVSEVNDLIVLAQKLLHKGALGNLLLAGACAEQEGHARAAPGFVSS